MRRFPAETTSLLVVKANGQRYAIERDRTTGELWFTRRGPGGDEGASPLGRTGGAGSEPFEHFIFAGRVPSGARQVEVTFDGRLYRPKRRSGLWIAAVPWGGREMVGEARFVDADGSVVGDVPVVAPKVPARYRLAASSPRSSSDSTRGSRPA